MTPTRSRWIGAAASLLAAALAVPAGAATVLPSGDAAACTAVPAQPGFTPLFDGSSLDGWKHSGPGKVTVNAACELQTEGGLGLFWYEKKAFEAYTLRLDWKIEKVVDNSGIFIGFPHDATTAHNTSISKGYEVQIDQVGRSTGDRKLITGAIYNIQGPNRDTRTEVAKPNDWNTYEITVDAPKVKIVLNGVLVNEFTANSTSRPITTPGNQTHFGLQAHGTGDVAFFRNVQVKEIAPGSAGGGGGGTGGGGGEEPPAVPKGDLSSLRNNIGVWSDPRGGAGFDSGGYAYDAQALRVAGVAPGQKLTAAGTTYTWPQTAPGTKDNILVTGQEVTLTAPAGATTLGVLGAATNGSASGDWALNYRDAAGQRVTRTERVEFGDWCANAIGSNTTVITTSWRSLVVSGGVAAPFPTTCRVFATSVPLDPTLQLESVTMTPGSGAMHVFDVVAK